MKRTLALILALILCLSLAACGGSDSSSDSGNTITSANEAIQAVKSGNGWTDAANEIAVDLGFKRYGDPSWGTCSASQNPDGSWDVTLKGKISGYTDDYNDNFESETFDYTVTIGADGSVDWYTGKTR